MADDAPWGVRTARAIVRASASLLPAWRGRDWQREWDAEISWYVRQHSVGGRLPFRRQLLLVRRTFGAIPHLLWLSRPQERIRMIDVRHSLRRLGQYRVTTLVAVISLALGIGANTVIFSAINALLLRPLPYPDPDEIVRVTATVPANNWTDSSMPWPDVADFRSRASTLRHVAGFRPAGVTMIAGGQPQRVDGVAVEWTMFDVLGVRPAAGRAFSSNEDHPGGDRVVVLLHELAAREFGSADAAVGRAVTLNEVPHTVIGVMPAEFRFPRNDDAVFIAPLRHNATTWNRASGGLLALARLKPGDTPERASEEVAAIAQQLASEYPRTNTGRGARVIALFDDLYSADFRLMLFLLWGAVALVLCIAILNVANVQLAHAMARTREIALRAALGGSPTRVAALVLSESVLLGLLGAAGAVVVAHYGTSVLIAIAPAGVSRLEDIRLDGRGLAFTAALGLAAGVLFGLAPAIHARSTALITSLKEGSRGTGGPQGVALRRALVVMQVAIAVVLLIAAGLLTRSMRELLTIDPGFRTDNVITFQVTLPGRYSTAAQVTDFQRRALEELQRMPGVSAAGATLAIPLAGAINNNDFYIEGEPAVSGQRPNTGSSFVTPGYFATLSIPTVRGRTFTEQDAPGAPGVAVLSAAAAARYFPGTEPIGRRLRMNWDSTKDGQPYWRTIVGVVGDVRHSGWRADPRSEIYVPYAQLPWPVRDMTFTIAHDAGAASLLPTAREAMLRVDRSVPLYQARTMREIVGNQLADTNVLTWLLGTFSAVGTALAGLGLFGVISFTVAQRTREVGIRAALGAAPGRLMAGVVRQCFVLVIAGAAIGLVAALAGARLLDSVLYNVRSSDPIAIASTIALIGAVGLVACWVPARRAARVDPVIALRHD